MQKVLCRAPWSWTLVSMAVLTTVFWIHMPRSEKTGDRAYGLGQRDARARINEAYGRIPLHFEVNQGQTDERVKFLTRGRDYTMFLTERDAVLTLNHGTASAPKERRSMQPLSEVNDAKRSVLRMTFAGANPNPHVVGQDELPGRINYFKGKDPAGWRVNVPTYARVRYEDLFPGIDLVYYGNQQALEYDFVVHPGSDPTHVAIRFEGAEKTEVDAQGDLVLHTAAGAIRQRKPLIYQELDGVRHEISGSYVLAANDTVGFQVGDYDATRPLVIDPVLFYSTYLGGSNSETGNGIAVDASGSAYVTGNTDSPDFPTAAGTLQGSSDAYVTKLDSTGSELVYSTYLGGTDGDVGIAIFVDVAGGAYVAGNTSSVDFPTTVLAFDSTLNDGMNVSDNDAFVARLDPAGSALAYATYLGGTGFDIAGDIAVDAMGQAYVTGGTNSGDFPTTPLAFQQSYGGGFLDAFVTKLNVLGSTLVYSTYLGGPDPQNDFGGSIAIDGAGNAYVAGGTSGMFPTTPGAFDTISDSRDVFVSKLDSTGSTLVYSTYVGGSEYDDLVEGGIAVDAMGNAYVTGVTQSVDFPTMNPFQGTLNGFGDAFVTKLNAAGNGLVYSTYLGGSDGEDGLGIAVDTNGSAYILGSTASTDFPVTMGAFQSGLAGATDAFVAKLTAAGSGLVYASYLGGSAQDTSNGDIVLDESVVDPIVYVAGTTSSFDFPTTEGAFDTTFNGSFGGRGTWLRLSTPWPRQDRRRAG